MRLPLVLAFTILLSVGGRPSLAAPPPAKPGDAKAPKVTSKRLEEGYGKIKDGMTVDQLTELLGPVTAIKVPGDPLIKNCDQELRWIDRTTVNVTFKAGKLTDVYAELSPTLAFERVTQANVLRLAPGITETEVVDVLGAGYWSREEKDGSKVLGWTPVVSVTVQLYKGKAGKARAMRSSTSSLE